MDWYESLERTGLDPLLGRKAEALANALAHLPGSRAFKVRWCRQHVPLLEAQADEAGKLSGPPRSGCIRGTALRYYTHQWKHLDAALKRTDLDQLQREQVEAPLAVEEELPPLLRLIQGGGLRR